MDNEVLIGNKKIKENVIEANWENLGERVAIGDLRIHIHLLGTGATMYMCGGRQITVKALNKNITRTLRL